MRLTFMSNEKTTCRRRLRPSYYIFLIIPHFIICHSCGEVFVVNISSNVEQIILIVSACNANFYYIDASHFPAFIKKI